MKWLIVCSGCFSGVLLSNFLKKKHFFRTSGHLCRHSRSSLQVLLDTFPSLSKDNVLQGAAASEKFPLTLEQSLIISINFL